MQLQLSDIDELLEIMNSVRSKVECKVLAPEFEATVQCRKLLYHFLLYFQREVLDELRQSAFAQPYKRL